MKNKHHLSKVGLLQALGIAIYCGLIGGFLTFMESSSLTPPRYLGPSVMLILLVFSVAVCGSIIFGYPVYLAIKDRAKEALKLLAYTLLYCLAIVEIAVLAIFIFS
ncbi:MAG TPA: hypothetical protein VJK25_03740 [Patescibacteria group bacterium]|nr:hypothetical protein [Patescibacteria group bacterium]